MSSARVNPVSPPWQFANAKIGPFSLGDFALADKWLSTSIAVPQARIGHCQFYNISNCSRVVIVIAISQCITPSKAPFGDYSCVGYDNFSARQGFSLYVPEFRLIGAGKLNISDIQLSEEVGDMAANLQVLGAGGETSGYYNWMTPATAKDFEYTDGSRGCWVDSELALVSDVELENGECVQIDVGETEGAKIQSNGQVSDEDVTYPTRQGFNFVGNAFPTQIALIDVQLSEEVGDMAGNLQILGVGGETTYYYNWMTPATAKDFEYTDGSRGCWVDSELALVEGDPITGGSGFQVDVGEAEGASVSVLAPFEL